MLPSKNVSWPHFSWATLYMKSGFRDKRTQNDNTVHRLEHNETLIASCCYRHWSGMVSPGAGEVFRHSQWSGDSPATFVWKTGRHPVPQWRHADGTTNCRARRSETWPEAWPWHCHWPRWTPSRLLQNHFCTTGSPWQQRRRHGNAATSPLPRDASYGSWKVLFYTVIRYVKFNYLIYLLHRCKTFFLFLKIIFRCFLIFTNIFVAYAEFLYFIHY